MIQKVEEAVSDHQLTIQGTTYEQLHDSFSNVFHDSLQNEFHLTAAGS